MGRTARAWKRFRRAIDAAREAENPALQSFAIAEAAYIPLLGGNHRAALPLLRQARDLPAPVGSPAFRAWLCGAEAEAHAAAGDADACHQVRRSVVCARARASTLADLAASFLQQGEIEEGCRIAAQALTLARNTRSARCEQRIVVLRSQVRLGADTPAVRQLDEQLRLA